MGSTKDINEELFHDNWANSVDVSSIDVTKINTACTSPELRCIADKLGDVRGKSFLDLGCGLGEVSVYYACKGAVVTSLDISGQMLEVAGRLAAQNNVSIRTVKSSAESIELNERFDIVYAGNVFHHMDIKDTMPYLKKLLAPNGILVSWDPIAYNPIINIYRRIATKVRTIDEHPLKKADIQYFKEHFNVVKTEFFWLTTLSIFMAMFLFQFKSPNKQRYWKVIIDDADKWKNIYRPLEKADKFLLKIFPPLKYLCWNIVMVCEQPKE